MRRSMVGSASSPMVTTVAPTIPVEAASSAPTTMTEMESPPRRRPNSSAMVSSKSAARPDLSSVIPIKMNKGTATRVKFCITPQMRRGSRLKKGRPNPISPYRMANAPMVKATG